MVALLSGLLALAGRALADPLPDEEISDAGPAARVAPELDDELIRSPIDVGSALVDDNFTTASGLVDSTSAREIEARRQPASRWGRIDLSIAWRRTDRLGEDARREEVWLVATWRH